MSGIEEGAAVAPQAAQGTTAVAADTGAAAAETTAQQGGRGLGGNARGGFQQLRQQSQQQAEAAKKAAADKAAQAKAEADRISEQNPEVAAARAAAEQKAAVAREQGEKLAAENKAILQQNADAAKQAGQEMKEMQNMTPEQRQAAMAQKAAAARSAGGNMYAQNKEMLEKNKAAADSARREAERTAQEAKAQAAVLGTQAVTAGVTAAHTAVNIARDDFERRCAAAQAKDEKLRGVALEVEKREKQLSLILAKTEPNWPKKCCCIEPMVHHDILGDIPAERQTFVTWSYRNYFFTCFLLICNFALALTMLLLTNKTDEETGKEKKTDDNEQIQHMGISVLYLTGIIFAFIIWYWPVYKACGTGSSGQYIMAFIGLTTALFFDLFTAIGPVGYGGTGLIWALEVKNNKETNAFYPAIIMALLWIIQSCWFIYMIWKLYQFYRDDKASLAKAKGELFANEIKSSLGAK